MNYGVWMTKIFTDGPEGGRSGKRIALLCLSSDLDNQNYQSG